jgi:hypothetical protein
MKSEIRVGKGVEINDSNISENFKNACLYLEDECSKLIDLEKTSGIEGE